MEEVETRINVRKDDMRFKSVTLTKVENGYLLSAIESRLGEQPRQIDYVFAEYEEVILFLKPPSLKLASAH